MKKPPERRARTRSPRVMVERFQEWVPAAQAGDREALERLLQASVGVVHAVARSRLGDTHAAEVAAADALARVARGLPGLKDARAYPRWLHRVTVRSTVLRTRKHAPRLLGGVPAGADLAAGPVETLLAVERAQRIRSAVAALNPSLRECVLLYFVEGLTYREIATLTGVGLGSVARRIRRGLTVIRTALESEEDV